MNPVSSAIEIVGLQPLAAHCGVTYQAVRKWERTRCPAERCSAVEKATGGKVTCHDLRPDVFPAPAATPHSSEAATP